MFKSGYEVFQENYDKFVAIAGRIVGDDAQDIVQNMYEQMSQRTFPAWPEDRMFRYLCGVCVTLAKNHKRGEKRRRQIEWAWAVRQQGQAASAEEEYLACEMAQQLEGLI